MKQTNKEDYLPYKYPDLADLMGYDANYYHQDFKIYYGTKENVLKAFCNQESKEKRQKTIKDIQAFLTASFAKYESDENAMEDQIYEDLLRMRLGYFYPNGGYTGVSWLKHLEAEIQKSLD